MIVGATGGVGQFLTQLAGQQNLKVIATGTQKDVSMLKSLGASVVVDYVAGDVSNQVRQQFVNGIEGLMDLVSDAPAFADYCKLVRGGGVALTTNFVADDKELERNHLRGGNFVLGASPALVERLGASARNGELKVAIQKPVPFNEGIAALTAARTGQARGKTVLMI